MVRLFLAISSYQYLESLRKLCSENVCSLKLPDKLCRVPRSYAKNEASVRECGAANSEFNSSIHAVIAGTEIRIARYVGILL